MKNKKEIIRKIIFAIALIVFIYSSYELFKIVKSYRDNAKVYNEVEELGPKFEIDEETKEVKPYEFKQEDYEKLKNMNGDFKGWIMIPNTEINYPIVQGRDNDYYLTHNFKKEYNAGGSIFASADNKNPFNEENTTIHGHYMKDGSMFGSLHKFKEEQFSRDNRKIYITTQEGVLTYEIFSIYIEKADSYPYSYSFGSKESYVEFLNTIKSKSKYNFGDYSFNSSDEIITVSTCSYEEEDFRLVIHGKLIE